MTASAAETHFLDELVELLLLLRREQGPRILLRTLEDFRRRRVEFGLLLVVIGLALRREGQVVRQFLLCDLERGLFTRAEYDQVGSIFGRMGSSFNALTQAGVRGWRTRMKFNQIASELAFHRCRVSKGLHSSRIDVHQLEAAYLQALEDLIREFRAS